METSLTETTLSFDHHDPLNVQAGLLFSRRSNLKLSLKYGSRRT